MSERARRVFVAKDVVADILPPPMYLVELRLVLSQAVEGTLSRSQARARFDALESDYRARVKHWTEHAPDGLETQLLGRQHAAAQRFLEAARAGLIDAPAEATSAELGQRLSALHPLYEEHRLGVDETVVVGNRFAETAALEFGRILEFSRVLSFGLVALALLTVFLGYRSVYRQLQRPLQGLADGARRMALGDLAAPSLAQKSRSDVIGELERSIEQMRLHLSTLVKAVRTNAFAVATGSTQIARSNDELFKRAEAQASSLQASASAMTDLCESVRNNADKALEANRLAAKASEVAAEGGAVVQQMVEVIERVDESSRRIADIIGVIDGIAFQTNILALNAAVEAARAGDQGRGFAVVASEVRSLAQRSSEAAREIRQLIGTSVQHVSESTALAGQAGRTMQAIVGSIGQVTDIVSDISQSSHHDSDVASVAGQVASIMDESSQRNAASMEESSAAAEELKLEAQQLVQAVAVFKLDEQPSA